MGSKSGDNRSLFSFNWYESLQFKIAAIFLVLFLFISLSIFMILKSFGDTIIEEQAYLRLNQANSDVVSELKLHTMLGTTIAQSMAELAKKLPNDADLYNSYMPQIIKHQGSNSFLAGGGIWPAPYLFDKDIERHSFFWIRDRAGTLNPNDHYNQARGKGYHNEEWYVPATFLSDGVVYWSKSYVDRYSLEPIVTASVPLIKHQKNVGVATVDIKLEGLQQLLKQVSRPFGGYAFAIDRNGAFLSYPSLDTVISPTQVNGLKSFITYQDLAKKTPQFAPLADILNQQNSDLIKKTSKLNHNVQQLSDQLCKQSEQITEEEAKLIAVSILSPFRKDDHALPIRTNLVIEDDPLLNEQVFVAITMMPDTLWKIITVMPYSQSVEKITATYKRLMQSTLVALLLTILIIWLFTRYFVTSPITNLAKQIQSQVDSNSTDMTLFATSSKGELNALVKIFNQRTSQLLNSQSKIENLANFDPLTGLPNRRMLKKRLAEKVENADTQQTYGALLFIDLDNFKRINDSLGHNMGDKLLIILAKRFTDSMDTDDMIARLGGDEFVVLILKKDTYSRKITAQATSAAQQLVDAMKEPIILNGRPYHMTISVGITIFSNQNNDSGELLRQADTAMYQAKDNGKNCFALFNTQMQIDALRRVEIEDAMHIALKNKELFLVYQPQVDPQGNCYAVESLVRWKHPLKGMLSPDEFIEIAEESALILSLGTWVLDASCAQFIALKKEGLHLTKISVNVSPKQFRDLHFIDTVRSVLDKHQLDPAQLTLEITEGIVIDDIKDTIYKMDVLKTLGVKLSIDDFGTGYSSLRYLKELPLNQLKIDQSFIRDIVNQPKDVMIVSTIIAIANHMKLNVVAEGIEDKAQFDMLVDIGCKQFQGYYFAKPKTVAELRHYLIEQKQQKNN